MSTTSKKLTKKEMAIQILMDKDNAIKTEYKDIIIINYTKSGKPVVAIWETRSHRTTYHYSFDDADRLFQFIEQRKQQADKREAQKLEQEKKYAEEKKAFVPGAILYSSWGYEQTNIDWYVILERKNDFVTIQQIENVKTYDNGFNDRGDCTPDVNTKIGEPFRKKITKYASINLEPYIGCWLWDGKSKAWSSYA